MAWIFIKWGRELELRHDHEDKGLPKVYRDDDIIKCFRCGTSVPEEVITQAKLLGNVIIMVRTLDSRQGYHYIYCYI